MNFPGNSNNNTKAIDNQIQLHEEVDDTEPVITQSVSRRK